MLTADLVRPRLKTNGNRLTIAMLDENNPRWLETAQELIDLFEAFARQPRHLWETALEAYEGDRIDYIVIRGLAKVLGDNAEFYPRETEMAPVELRRQLFEHGPVFSAKDLFHQQTRDDVIAELGFSDVNNTMFADLPGEYLLEAIGEQWTPSMLINRYNLELARGVLYWATEMTIQVHDTFKDFWRYVKLFKLMFWGTPLQSGGYEVQLDGPISPFVKSSTRYGRQFATFLPALFLCETWSMQAKVRQFDKPLNYELDESVPLASHFKRSQEFDSRMEADFAAEFRAKFGEERGKWRLEREDEIILLGDMVMVPDFSIINKKDGRKAIIEIVGFWHPDYLKRKIKKVRAAKMKNLILLVYEGVNLTSEQLEDVPAEVLYFKNKPVLKHVMEAVARVAK
jgi:predicted nuclease of restriction endonuclease-like RecB superfamily